MVAALGMTACGDDDSDNTSAAETSTSAAASATDTVTLPPVPTVEELNADLARALDPSVPAAEKLEKIQGAEVDPTLPDRLAQAAAENNVEIQVVDVSSFGEAVEAKAIFTLNGEPQPEVGVPFVVDNGKWKIQKTWACNMLANLGEESVACA